MSDSMRSDRPHREEFVALVKGIADTLATDEGYDELAERLWARLVAGEAARFALSLSSEAAPNDARGADAPRLGDRPEYERSLHGDAIPQKPIGGDAVTRPAPHRSGSLEQAVAQALSEIGHTYQCSDDRPDAPWICTCDYAERLAARVAAAIREGMAAMHYEFYGEGITENMLAHGADAAVVMLGRIE